MRLADILRQSVVFTLTVCLILTATSLRAAENTTALSLTPFDNPARFSEMDSQLPDLGGDSTSGQRRWLEHIAQTVKTIGEATNRSGNNHSFSDEAGEWAFENFRDAVAKRAENEGQQLLSPYGTASIALMVDNHGRFNGSSASLLTPLADRQQQLTFSQIGFGQTDVGPVANAGIGQRWMTRNWMFGYNAFLDQLINENMRRASLGTEAWGDFLHISANYYQPVTGWHNRSDNLQMQMARGYDITTKGYLPFYRQLGISLTWEQYLGNNVDLFNSGNRYKNPSAIALGVSYTPVPLLTFSASHSEGDKGERQDQVGLKMTWRPGVSLSQQLSADNVAVAHSLLGSRYDSVERNPQPVMAFRQRKTLSVFLATPPWQVHAGENLPLKLQVHHTYAVHALSWQGDTQALSLTPPANNASTEGWSIIIPAWDSTAGASNQYHLSVTVEDSHQQRVTSNWITLQLEPPVNSAPLAQPDFDVMAP
ncbi:invasin [Erwinia sp. OLTSP20]|nr:invasin [Erwinia sp. OAMSP11]PIJ71405.1 invasin [Erwinia sp. OLSSP12]PIJ80639.1 invasin [Erwinia sp. OLCASP19]PIJ82803.1 invasin [Erwinia sp. OLMTSP26]PIJ85489.1 invasin [Erwinia sp. OLMDSP33]PIJ92206.1 invasin [Erwinia sp. OLTSP20]PIJ93303.1 invasin [Erwinia sp. OLFS4]